ncbi:hypothetical protein [Ruminococcus sp. NK3A76]|uniref:hypothetical protein n=1 Tax=Ruminococcus sp. NK3A76 TaxID=877411 RepID=UPI0004915FDA|nr:hypothetical protein [Ruminococcus sp. NK3A76]
MSKKDVQIDRWFYEIPDLIPDSEGKTVIVKIKSFGPLEVFEWGICSDGVPYELYNWCENDLCEHENYCRPTTAETLWKKIKATPHEDCAQIAQSAFSSDRTDFPKEYYRISRKKCVI